MLFIIYNYLDFLSTDPREKRTSVAECTTARITAAPAGVECTTARITSDPAGAECTTARITAAAARWRRAYPAQP